MGFVGSFKNVCIRALAVSVPGERISNESFHGKIDDKQLKKFEKVTGVFGRYHAKNLTTLDLAEDAALRLKEKNVWTPDSIDAIVFVTQSPDVTMPNTACILHGRLGIKQSCLAFDVNLGCSGFVNGLHIASSLLSSGMKRVMLAGGDCLSRLTDCEDISNLMLLGDAGFAVILDYDEENGQTLPYLVGSKGDEASIIATKGMNSWFTTKHLLDVDEDFHFFKMDGLNVFNFTINTVPSQIKEFCECHHTDIKSFEHFCFHQANRFILKQIALYAGFMDKQHLISIDRYGNTSPASIPVTICDAGERIQSGTTLLAGYGVGLSWGVMSYDFTETLILPIHEVKEIDNV